MGVKRFEDLKVWNKARMFANFIYKLTRKKIFSEDWGLSRQAQRASVSVMANIAEGFERGSNKEFRNFLFIAKSSLAETKSHFYLAYDQKYITENELKEAQKKANELSSMLTSLLKHLRDNPEGGVKNF